MGRSAGYSPSVARDRGRQAAGWRPKSPLDAEPMDLLESLASVEVPPVPAASEFTAGVRRKLHPRLLAAHVAGFALQALPWAAVQFVAAVLAVLRFSATGSWPAGRRPRRAADGAGPSRET